MPYTSVWRNPALFLTRKGVRVYCTYKDDEFNNGPSTYHFTTNQEGTYDDETDQFYFDVRELPTWTEPKHPPYLNEPGADTPENNKAWELFHAKTEPAAIRTAIRAAIDQGTITKDGVKLPPKPSGLPIPPLAPPDLGA
jgi:hypothetical protein